MIHFVPDMDKENPNSDSVSERAKSIIYATAFEVEKLEDTSSSELLKEKWSVAKGNPNLPIYTYSETLLEAGVDEVHIKTLMDLMRDLKIDVSDPHTSSSELSVIAGVLSGELLGIDISKHRRLIDRVKLIPVVIQEIIPQPSPSDLIYTDNERLQYQELARLKEWQRALILSNRSYLEISRQLLVRNNQALEILTRGHLEMFWRDNGIEEDSRATVYFRDHKTYAGDIDFYYWGPEPEKCTLEMSRYLMSLGYKVDHRSNILVDELIKRGEKIDNGYLGAYLQMYFFMGKTIEFNGDNFHERYALDVSSIVDLDRLWQTTHKSIIPAADLTEHVYRQDNPEYPGLKDLPFRLLSVTLMGLAIKYGVPFTLDYEELLSNLDQHLNEDEISTLRSSFYYINQARNLYQSISERRWEMISPEIKQEINKAIVIQLGSTIEDMMSLFGNRIKAIAARHFGEPRDSDVLDLSESREEASSFVAQSYKKVGVIYRQLAKL